MTQSTLSKGIRSEQELLRDIVADRLLHEGDDYGREQARGSIEANPEIWKFLNRGFSVHALRSSTQEVPLFPGQAIDLTAIRNYADDADVLIGLTIESPADGFGDWGTNFPTDDDVAKARQRFEKPINDALEDGRGDLSDDTALAASDMLDAADRFRNEHEVLTYVTSDNDAITKVSDWRGNYVVMKSRSDDKSVVHFNIRSYKEFDRRDEAKKFALSLLGCLKRRSTES